MTSTTSRIQTRLPRVAGAIQMSSRVRAALDGRYPLTVLRAARGFGKTSVLVTWLRETADQIPAIYHALDSSSATEDGFWRHLARALEQAGLPLLDGDDEPREQVIATIAALRSPVRLILDDMHEAGASEDATRIDDDLVEMVRRNAEFYLIASGRSMRDLESTGALSVEAAVLGPEDLTLDADRVASLAAELGIDLEAGCAAQTVADVGGWPAAIRAGLTNATPESAVDEDLVAGYLGAVLRDMPSEAARSFFLHTAVPEDFDAELAAALIPEDQDGWVLNEVRGAGLLRQARADDGTTRYRYPPAIRRGLLRVLRDSEPKREARVHQRLMQHSAASHDPTNVIMHAVRAQDWDVVTEVLDRQWVYLLTASPDVLADMARQVPADVAHSDARLRLLRQHNAVLADPDSNHRTTWPVSDHPTLAAEVIARVTQAEQRIDEEALALLLWGVASLTAGDHDMAIYVFNQTRARGLATGSSTVVALGTVGLALVYALNGEPSMAQQWLSEPEITALFPAPSESVPAVPDQPDVASSSVSIARALAAVDRATPEAEQTVAALINPPHRGDVWAMSIFARAHHVAIGSDPEEVFRQANQVRAALRYVARGTLSETVLSSTLVELQLFAQMSGVALESAQQMRPDPIGWTTMAKAHLGRQEYDPAVEYASKAVDADRISQRSLLESHVILAAAQYGRGENALARQAFARAVALARATGQRRPFFLMRRYVFEILADRDPGILRLWPESCGAQASGEVGPDLEFPTLTMREAQILRALERHSGPVGIGRSLGVSTNTVKTHLRAIYRKLGVSSRNEALDAVGRSSASPSDDD